MTTRILPGLLALMLAGAVSGEEFSLASIRNGEAEAAKIIVPESAGPDPVIVLCAAVSQPATQNVPYFCYRPNPEKDPYMVAINNGMPMLPLTPGRIDGREVHAWFNFSVVFSHADNRATIFPSLLYAPPNELTPYFSAPQRVLKHKGPRGCRSNQIAWATLQVNESGVPSVPADLVPPETSCGRQALKLLEKSDYIPANFNGRNIPSLYREPFEKEMAKTPDEIRNYGGRTTRRLPSGMNLPFQPPTL